MGDTSRRENRRRPRPGGLRPGRRALVVGAVATLALAAAGVTVTSALPGGDGSDAVGSVGWWGSRSGASRPTATRTGGTRTAVTRPTGSRTATRTWTSPDRTGWTRRAATGSTTTDGAPATSTPTGTTTSEATSSSATSSSTTSTSASTAGASSTSMTTTSATSSSASSSKAPTPAPPAAAGRWQPRVGATWQLQYTGTLDLNQNVDVYDLDLFDTSAATVASIHAKGARAVCYIEVGAWESYRPDAGSYPASLLGKGVGGYPQEKYVDVRQLSTLRSILGARMDLCRQKGFDGVDPDLDDTVVDAGAAGIGFPGTTYADQLAFNTMLSQEAHARGLAFGLKNGTYGANAKQFVADVQPLVDFAVNEQCVAAGNLCAPLTSLISNGKPVFHTEYLSDYSSASASNPSSALNAFCTKTKALGFSSILKDASETLGPWRAACP